MQAQRQKKQVPGFDLQGIEAIMEFTGKSINTLNTWKVHYGLPVVKKGIWFANKSDLEAWAFKFGRPIRKLTVAHVHALWERKKLEEELATGAGDIFEGSILEIARNLDIPDNVLKKWFDDYSDFPMEHNGKKTFRLARAALELWFRRHPMVRKVRGPNEVEYAF